MEGFGSGPTVVAIEGVPTALCICKDLWVEGPAAQARAAGARLIVNINASPFHTRKAGEREAVLWRALAEGGLPIVYLNLVDGQDELVFDGGSVAMDSRYGKRRFPVWTDLHGHRQPGGRTP